MPNSGDRYEIPLGFNLDQITDDLAQVDRQVEQLRSKIVSMHNQRAGVRSGALPYATSTSDIPASSYTPAMRALDEQLNQRVSALRQQASSGRFAPNPPTPQDLLRQGAQERLQQAQSQAAGKPVMVQGVSEFWQKFKSTLKEASPERAAMDVARGDLVGAGRQLFRAGLGAVVDNPYAAAGAAVAAGSVAIATGYAPIARTEASMASSLVDTKGVDQDALQRAIVDQSTDFGYDQGVGQKTALDLAGQGVRASHLIPNLASTLAFARRSGMNPADVQPVVGTMATTGGLNPLQISQMLQDIGNAAGQLNVPVSQLLASMKQLSQSSTGAAKDVADLALVQKALGPSSGINAGSLLSGVTTQFGTQALQTSAMIGLSPTQFARDQRGGKGEMLDILRHAGTFVSQFQGAPPQVTEQLLSGIFGAGYNNLTDQQKDTFRQDLTSGRFSQAYSQYAGTQRRIVHARETPSTFQEKSTRPEQTGPITNAEQALWRDWFDTETNLGPLPQKAPPLLKYVGSQLTLQSLIGNAFRGFNVGMPNMPAPAPQQDSLKITVHVVNNSGMTLGKTTTQHTAKKGARSNTRWR